MTLRTRALLLLPLAPIGAALAYTALPLELPPVCLFKRFTGLPCPSCGMTHAFCALAHGRIADAAHFNLASLPLALLLAVGFTLLALELFTNRPCVTPLWQKSKRFVVLAGAPILLTAWCLNLCAYLLPR